MLATLLLDSRGLLTISPVLAMGASAPGCFYKRGRRAEAPHDHRRLRLLPGLQLRLLPALRRRLHGAALSDDDDPVPGAADRYRFEALSRPTIALAGVSLTTMIIATVTHPLIGYENETVTWMRYVRQGLFQPTIASAYGLGRGWGGIWPFLLAAGGAIVLGNACDSTHAHLTRSLLAGVRARRLVPVCAARTHIARDRPPRPAESSKRATTPR